MKNENIIDLAINAYNKGEYQKAQSLFENHFDNEEGVD